MEENNLDKYFQEKLANHSETPPASVWEGIEANMPSTGLPWYKKYFWLLLLFIFISGSAFLGYQLYEIDSRVTTLEQKIDTNQGVQQKESTELEGSQKEIGRSNSDEKSEVQEGSEMLPSEQMKRAVAINTNLTTEDENYGKSEGEKGSITNEVSTSSLKEDKSIHEDKEDVSNHQISVADIASSDPTRDQKNSQTNTVSNNVPTGKAFPLGAIDSKPSEAESSALSSSNFPKPQGQIQTEEWKKMEFILPHFITKPQVASRLMGEPRETDYYSLPKKNWYLFGYGMANYTHRRVVKEEDATTEIANELNTLENGLIRPGAGLILFRDLNKSLRLGIGLEYNEWVQEADYSIEVPFEEVTEEFLVTTGTSEYSFNGSLESSFGSTGYLANSDENFFNVEFATINPDVDPLEIDISTRRTISYLTIPLTLEYVIDSYPWRFTAGGGISVNQIVNSRLETTIVPDTVGLRIAEGESVQGTYFAFQAGVAVEYMLSERMSVRINPIYRGWMTPIFENEEFRTLPFGVAIRGGLIYRLGK